MVWSGVYPVDSGDYENLRDAIEKLQLNDAAISREPDVSGCAGARIPARVPGPACTWRSCRSASSVSTTSTSSPPRPTSCTASSRRTARRGDPFSPSQLPDLGRIDQHRGAHRPRHDVLPEKPTSAACSSSVRIDGAPRSGFDFSAPGRVQLIYDIPYAEVVFDFFDRLKSVSRGYASMDYEIVEWRADDLVKVDILLNGELVDALSMLCHRTQAHPKGSALARKLKEFIPRQMFDVAIQAAIGSRVVARTTVKAMRKDVTAKCYGGDISRKRKLLEKQKKGKKRMKALGSVEVPQEAFLAVLKVGDGD